MFLKLVATILVASATITSSAPAPSSRLDEIERMLDDLLVLKMLSTRNERFEVSKKSVAEMFGLTAQQVEDYRNAFNAYDKDDSGSISKDEYKRILIKIHMRYDEPSLSDTFQTFDTDGDSVLNFEEFMYFMYVSVPADEEVPLASQARLFKEMDEDGNNMLSKEEEEAASRVLGHYVQAGKIEGDPFETVDTDGDGQISLNEFLKFFAFNFEW